MSPAGGPGSFRHDVQGLRALAVLLVVLDHAGVEGVGGGYLGVDVFFVLSGFLISGLLYAEVERTGTLSLTGFWARRARRILPAATVVLLATVAAGSLLLDGVEALRLLDDTIWAAFFAANVAFGRSGTDYWSQGEAVSPVQHYWSLAVEEQFYVLWPLLLLGVLALTAGRARRTGVAVARAGARGPLDRRAVGSVVAVLTVASLLWAVRATATSPQGAYFSAPARAWELGVGALVALALVPRPARRGVRATARARALLSWVGLVAVAVAAVGFDERTGVPGLPTLVPVGGTALLLLAGSRPHGGAVQRLLALAPLRWVGDRSYSLYLWHWPVLVLAARTLGPLTPLETVVAVAASVLLAASSYRFVEQPFRGRGRTTRVHRSWSGIALYPTSVLLVGAAVVAAHAGVVQRYADPRPAVTLASYGQSADDPRPAFSSDPQVALVQASVLAARNDVPVPNPLRPDPLDRRGWRAADLEGCGYYELPDPMPLCRRGDPDGDRTLVLLGDSHAQHWIPAVEPLARRHGYRAYFLVYSACTPALVMPWSPLKDAPDEDCVGFHAWSQDQVERLRPDVVLMATDAQPSYLDGDGTRVRSGRGVAALLGEGMAARIASLRPHAGRVVVLGDPPRLTVDPETALDSRDTLADGLAPPDPRSLLVRRAVREAARRAGAEYVETAPWFCAWGRCPVVVGDHVTRRDRGHVTQAYSASLRPSLEPELRLGSVR